MVQDFWTIKEDECRSFASFALFTTLADSTIHNRFAPTLCGCRLFQPRSSAARAAQTLTGFACARLL